MFDFKYRYRFEESDIGRGLPHTVPCNRLDVLNDCSLFEIVAHGFFQIQIVMRNSKYQIFTAVKFPEQEAVSEETRLLQTAGASTLRKLINFLF